jgi:hypothetical protein
LVCAFGIIPNDVGYCRLGRARQAKAEQSQRLKETAHDGHEELLVRHPSRHQIPSLDLIDVEALAKSVTVQSNAMQGERFRCPARRYSNMMPMPAQ